MRFIDLLDDYGIDWTSEGKRTTEGWVQFDCLFCHLDCGMGYNVNGGFFNCWRCGSHSRMSVIQEITKYNTTIASSIIRKIKEDDDWLNYRKARRLSQSEIQNTKTTTPPLADLLNSKPHMEYLRSRKFDPKSLCTLWKLKAIHHHPVYGWRIFIPVYWQTKLVSWTSRQIGTGSTAKYLHSKPSWEVLPIKSLLYGHDYTRNSVVIHEGPADVWATGPGSVALFGVNWTLDQLYHLSKFSMRVVCFDSEKEAQKRAISLCENLSVFDGETINVELQSGKDPAEADPKEIKELRSKYLRS